jgi:mannose-6-phosphate isomerase-like protein (cupin superfamily)
MTVTFCNLTKLKKLPLGHSKKVLANTDDSHVWIHGDYPGTQGPMHRHTADEIFYCVQGECTFTLDRGRRKTLKPGMVVFIPKGDFYKLENTGTEYLILLGMRSEPSRRARFGTKGEVTGANVWALENRPRIVARQREIAEAAFKIGKPNTGKRTRSGVRRAPSGKKRAS